MVKGASKTTGTLHCCVVESGALKRLPVPGLTMLAERLGASSVRSAVLRVLRSKTTLL